MATTATIQARITKNGGPQSKDKYKAYYNDGSSAKEDWARGELVFLDPTGVVCRGDATRTNGTFGTAKSLALDASNDPFAIARKWFIAQEDHDSSAEGESVYVSVQEILDTTILEVQLNASSTTAPTQANVLNGQMYGGYLETTGVWGIDVDDADATNGIFVVHSKSSDYAWMVAESGVAGTDGSGKQVEVRLLASLII